MVSDKCKNNVHGFINEDFKINMPLVRNSES